MWNFIKSLFGFGGETVLSTSPIASPPAPTNLRYRRSDVRAKRYYKKNERFYDREDDSIVNDVLLLIILIDMFDDGEIDDSNNTTMPEEDILDMDVSEIEVQPAMAEVVHESRNDHIASTTTSAPEPSYSEPERTSSYSNAGDSYSSDSGSASSDD